MRWTMKMTKRKTTMATPPQRLAHAPPVRSRTASPPCLSQRRPPPSTPRPPLITPRPTSWGVPTSRRCSATSPPCRVSGSHHRSCTATRLGGSAVSPITSKACRGCRAAGCWFPPPPPPWMRTSPSSPRTCPRHPPACPPLGSTTPAARPPSPRHPRPPPTGTSPRIATCRPTPDTSRPGETCLLSATSPPRGTSGWRGDTGETSPQGGDTCRCCPRSPDPRPPPDETTSGTSPREGATGG